MAESITQMQDPSGGVGITDLQVDFYATIRNWVHHNRIWSSISIVRCSTGLRRTLVHGHNRVLARLECTWGAAFQTSIQSDAFALYASCNHCFWYDLGTRLIGYACSDNLGTKYGWSSLVTLRPVSQNETRMDSSAENRCFNRCTFCGKRRRGRMMLRPIGTHHEHWRCYLPQ